MPNPPFTAVPTHQRRSIATVSISGALTDKLAAISAAGFDAVEIFENDLLYFDGSPDDVRRMTADLGLDIALYQPFRDFDGVNAERLIRNLERAKRKFDVMHQLGANRLLVCSNVSPDMIRDDDLCAEQLGKLAEAAQAAGITICYEALAWGCHVNTYRHAWKLVQMVNHLHLTLALDSFHTLALNDSPDAIAAIPGDRIGFVQIADAPKMNMDVLEWSRHYRCFPGQGDFALADFMAQVVKSRYRGPLSLEIFNDGFRGAPPAATAADGHRSLLLLEEATRAMLDADGKTGNASALSFAPPAAPATMQWQFLEFAVDGASRARVADWLRRLRFWRAGQHRSKDVTLYQHGSASIVLNAEPDSFAYAFFERHGLSLCASAFNVQDAALARERAASFGYAPFSSRVGPNERVVPAIEAPDGSLVYFVDERPDEPTLFEADFDLIDIDGAMEVGPITGIDHVCLSLPAGSFDSWVLFLKSVFGLTATPTVLVPDPHGLVRSRALSSANGALRIVLNASADAHTATAETVRAYHGSGLNHVAFATSDIFRAAMDFKTAGMPLLRIPENYYDDLAARYALTPEFLNELKQHNLLYDRDEHGGEFLHAYSETLDQRFFIELAQRSGGYDGYGAANAAVRLAAQARQRAAAAR